MQKILQDRIDPERWYDFDWAVGIYHRIAQQVGRGAVIAVGKKIIESAEFPPGSTTSSRC